MMVLEVKDGTFPRAVDLDVVITLRTTLPTSKQRTWKGWAGPYPVPPPQQPPPNRPIVPPATKHHTTTISVCPPCHHHHHHRPAQPNRSLSTHPPPNIFPVQPRRYRPRHPRPGTIISSQACPTSPTKKTERKEREKKHATHRNTDSPSLTAPSQQPPRRPCRDKTSIIGPNLFFFLSTINPVHLSPGPIPVVPNLFPLHPTRHNPHPRPILPTIRNNRVWCSGNIGDSHSPARGSTPRIRDFRSFFLMTPRHPSTTVNATHSHIFRSIVVSM
ncbi:hypothetical protein QBC39DRAFT_138771 [Podospora conica]|nr:hypothetical protein QBC39DRAFT_138771 [Schizothecium conicum]